jgi:hypothetical protein
MNKLLKFLFVLSIMAILLLPTNVFAVVQGNVSQGWDIFDPSQGGNYRYGPSIIVNSDNSIDAWFSSPGANGQWDWIRYKRSTDGGQTWSTEQVVLQPTTGADDALSTCDPAVVKFGGYYYMGYTSTLNGITNHVYVARSTLPTGPFEKWNGSGWGGNPSSFITYTETTDRFGAGEPSFVVKDDTLYIYYTWCSRQTDGTPIYQTRVSTASALDSNWPANLTYRGVAIEKRDEAVEDHSDVKYIDAYGKFIAVNSVKRFTSKSYVNMYESTDGITFTPSTLYQNNIELCCHNVGISGNELGHIDLTQDNFISYAYGTIWGEWYTKWNPISYTNTDLPAKPEIYSVNENNNSVSIYFKAISGVNYRIKYGTSSGNYTTTISGITSSPFTITGLTNGATYFAVMSAYNSYGESSNSTQYSFKPLEYATASASGVTTSSQLSGWAASNVTDSDVNTSWSSDVHSSANNTEWVCIDTGSCRGVKRVTITPRQKGEECYPKQFKIQVSMDGVVWNDAEFISNSYTVRTSYLSYVYTLESPIYGRYVRIYTTVMGSDASGGYYVQLGDIKIEGIPFSVSASSYLNSWEPYQVIDGNGSTCWSSNAHSSENSTEWICVDGGVQQTITGVRLTPRNTSDCFPKDFVIQYSQDAVSWVNINGQSYSDYPSPGTEEQSFQFDSPISARYIRIYATKLRPDVYNNYYFQLSQIQLDTSTRCVATVSSEMSGWEKSHAVDHVINTCWSSDLHSSAYSTEWFCVDAGSVINISGIMIKPRSGGICFPVNFTIKYSEDGVNWIDANGQKYNNYCNPGDVIQLFPFKSTVSARYIRVYATKLGADAYNNYYFKLSDIYLVL